MARDRHRRGRSNCKGTKHDELWTNSLFLYRDRVIVRIFDHMRDCWMTDLDRVVFPGRIGG